MRALLTRSAAVLALLFVATPSSALARTLSIDSFRAEIEVEKDGTVRVTERINLDFQGSWNGIFRHIRLGWQRGGVRGSMRLKLDSITDEQGTDLEYWETRRRGRVEFKIRVPRAFNAKRTVVIAYHCNYVIRRYGDDDENFAAHDELYWNVTGNDWMVTMKDVSAVVTLPDGVPAEEIRTAAYVGRYGARGGQERVRLTKTESAELRFDLASGLGRKEGMTIVVGFPPGYVSQPSSFQKMLWWLEDNWFVFLPLLAFLLWLGFWWKLGRDDMGQRTIIPEFEAPMGLKPTQIGILVDNRFDERDLTAAIVDLAVKGVVTVDNAGKFKTELQLNREAFMQAKLEGYETDLVNALFDDEERVKLRDLKYKFYKSISAIGSKATGSLIRKKLFRHRPSSTRALWTVLTFLATGALVGIGLALQLPAVYFGMWAVATIAMFVIAWAMPRRTPKGLDALAKIRGLEEYLVTAETERMRAMSYEQLEALIPVAITLGVEKKWLAAFESLFAQPPRWATQQAGWGSGSWSDMLGDMRSDVRKSLYATPRASSSGSSSGWGGGWSGGSGFSGGSSGGGFGGGGGGGW